MSLTHQGSLPQTNILNASFLHSFPSLSCDFYGVIPSVDFGISDFSFSCLRSFSYLPLCAEKCGKKQSFFLMLGGYAYLVPISKSFLSKVNILYLANLHRASRSSFGVGQSQRWLDRGSPCVVLCPNPTNFDSWKCREFQ